MIRPTLIIGLLLAAPMIVSGATLNVPADYSTIQSAVDAAAAGDKIVDSAARRRDALTG